MKNGRRYNVAAGPVLLCAGLLGAGNSAFSQTNCESFVPGTMDRTQLFSEFRGAVFRIGNGSIFGTAFLIDPTRGYLLTAWHVVKGAPITASTPARPDEVFQLTVVEKLEEYDLALLQLLGDTKWLADITPLDITLHPPTLDTLMITIGYPQVERGESGQVQQPYDAKPGRYIRGTPVGYLPVEQPVFPGSSGSPLIDATGGAVGVCKQEVGMSNIARYATLEDAEKLLDQVPPSTRLEELDDRLRKGELTRAQLVWALTKTSKTLTNLELRQWAKRIASSRSAYQKAEQYMKCPIIRALSDRKLDEAVLAFGDIAEPIDVARANIGIAEKYAIAGRTDDVERSVAAAEKALTQVRGKVEGESDDDWIRLGQLQIGLGKVDAAKKSLMTAQLAAAGTARKAEIADLIGRLDKRHSELQDINESNVKDLALAGSVPGDELSPGVKRPLVVGNTVFVGDDPWNNNVVAIDLNTNKVKWKYMPPGSPALNTSSPKLVYGKGKVVVQPANDALAALDAQTGKIVWSTTGVGAAGPLHIAGDKVVVCGTESDDRNFVAAYDVNTGKPLWKSYSAGTNSAMLVDPMKTTTWANGKLRTVGDSLNEGGSGNTLRSGSACQSYSYDAKSNVVYYSALDKTQGTARIWARELESGTAKWVFDSTPGESYDGDAFHEMVLADVTVHDKPTKTLVQFHRGVAYTLDRTSGALIGTEKQNPAVTMREAPSSAMSNYIAWDADKGKIVWSKPEKFSIWNSALSTGGDLVFHGTPEGYLVALSAKDGKELWKYKITSGTIGNVFTYRHNGKQYVGVYSDSAAWMKGAGEWTGFATGGYHEFGDITSTGGSLKVFAIP